MVEIQIVAAADVGFYIAKDIDHCFYVLSLGGTRPIAFGDILRGNFDGHGSLFYSVRNITTRKDVDIYLENWGCTLELAIGTLLDFMVGNPGSIQVGNKAFRSTALGLKEQLAKEIRALR